MEGLIILLILIICGALSIDNQSRGMVYHRSRPDTDPPSRR
jgi:hypothetical protein